MLYRSANYVQIEHLTDVERDIVMAATSRPAELTESISILLSDFFDRFIASKNGLKSLKANATLGRTLFTMLLERVDELQHMLSECQGVDEYIEI